MLVFRNAHRGMKRRLDENSLSPVECIHQNSEHKEKDMKHEFTPPPEKSPKEILESLTSREWELLLLIRRGLGNKEIARHLKVSVKTVEYHAGNLYQKLGVPSRAMASVWAEQHGIMNPDGDSLSEIPGDFPR